MVAGVASACVGDNEAERGDSITAEGDNTGDGVGCGFACICIVLALLASGNDTAATSTGEVVGGVAAGTGTDTPGVG